MRTSLFLAGIFGGFSLRNNNNSNSPIFGSSSSSSSSSNDDASVAEAAGLTPRGALEIEHFRDVGWYKGRRSPFSGKYRNYLLGDIIPLTHDTALFRFLLPEEDDEFHLKPCSTLQARITISGGGQDTVQRMYTPCTPNGTKGYFDIIVKRKTNGRMTSHLFGMRIGDVMQFRNILFKLNYKSNRWDEVGMIAGGTGFTPMLQVIHHALKPTEDPYEVKEAKEREEQQQKMLLLEQNKQQQEQQQEESNKIAETIEAGENASKLVFQQQPQQEVMMPAQPEAAMETTTLPSSVVIENTISNEQQQQQQQQATESKEISENNNETTVSSSIPEQQQQQQQPIIAEESISSNPDQIVITGDEVVNPVGKRLPVPPPPPQVAKEITTPTTNIFSTTASSREKINYHNNNNNSQSLPKATAKQPKAPEADRTKLSFLFCNRSEKHILLKTLFEKLANENPTRFRVKFCVDKPVHPETWTGYTGYVTKEMIRETMPPPTQKRSIILLCGPDHLLHRVAGTAYYALKELSGGRDLQPAAADLANLTNVGGILGEMGYTSDNVYKF